MIGFYMVKTVFVHVVSKIYHFVRLIGFKETLGEVFLIIFATKNHTPNSVTNIIDSTIIHMDCEVSILSHRG